MAKKVSSRPGQRSDAVRNAAAVEAAARSVFDRLGGELTMDDVAAEAGLSKGTVYKLFATRDALIEAMTLETLKEATVAYKEAARSDDPMAALRSILSVRPLTAAGRARMTAPGQGSNRIRRALADTARALEELLDAMKKKGLIDPAVNAWHIRVLIRGLYTVLPDYPNCSAAEGEQLLAVILRGISSSESR